MFSTKPAKYLTWFFLGIIAIFLLNEIVNAYYTFKSGIAAQKFEETVKDAEIKQKGDSVFYTAINNLLDHEKYDEAIVGIKTRIKLIPADKSFLAVNLGDIYEFKKDTLSALNSYSEAIKAEDFNVNALDKRARIYYSWNKLDSAIADYKVAAANNFDYFYILGELQEKKRDFREAIASMNSFLIHYPNSKQGKLKLASLKLKIKKSDQN